jgi:hypothetical protein
MTTFADKVEKLFEDRAIGELASFSGLSRRDGGKLRRLQACIYNLDQYFEDNWRIEPKAVSELWKPICDGTASLAGRSGASAQLLVEIRLYQALEESLRGNDAQRVSDLDVAYQLKTCDVRLARRLIAIASGTAPFSSYMALWALFDSIAECLDDFEDWREDLTTFNGNQLNCRLLATKSPAGVVDDFILFAQGRRLLLNAAWLRCGHDALARSVLTRAFDKLDALDFSVAGVAKKSGIYFAESRGGKIASASRTSSGLELGFVVSHHQGDRVSCHLLGAP